MCSWFGERCVLACAISETHGWLAARYLDGSLGAIRGVGGFRLAMDHIDDPVVARLLGAHPVVAVDVARKAVDVLSCIRSHHLLQTSFESKILGGVPLDVGGRPLDARR